MVQQARELCGLGEGVSRQKAITAVVAEAVLGHAQREVLGRAQRKVQRREQAVKGLYVYTLSPKTRVNRRQMHAACGTTRVRNTTKPTLLLSGLCT